MKAGIKFCGGCNPRYDRGSQTTGLRERLKEVQWVSGDDSQVCDFWLIICGCSRACVSTESLSAKQQILVIKSRMDFSRAICVYFARSSSGMSGWLSSMLRYATIEVSGVFKSCARNMTRSFFFFSHSSASNS